MAEVKMHEGRQCNAMSLLALLLFASTASSSSSPSSSRFMLGADEAAAAVRLLSPLSAVPQHTAFDGAALPRDESGALPLNRTELDPDLLESYSAYCLDGSPFYYYFRPASSAAASNKWVLWLQGGGLCVEKVDCLHRATTAYGSSKTWADQITSTDNVRRIDRQTDG